MLHPRRKYLQLGLLALGGMLLLFPPWQFVLDVPQKAHQVVKAGHRFVLCPPVLPRDEAYERWDAFASMAPRTARGATDRELSRWYHAEKEKGSVRTPEQFAVLVRQRATQSTAPEPSDALPSAPGMPWPEPDAGQRTPERQSAASIPTRSLTPRAESLLDAWTEHTRRVEQYWASPSAPQAAPRPTWPQYAEGVRAYWDRWYPEVDWGRLLLQAGVLGIVATGAVLATRTRSGSRPPALQQPNARLSTGQPSRVPEDGVEVAAAHVADSVVAPWVPPDSSSSPRAVVLDPAWEAHVRAIALWMLATGVALPLLAYFGRAASTALGGGTPSPYLSQPTDVQALAAGAIFVAVALGVRSLVPFARWAALGVFLLAAIGHATTFGPRSSTLVSLLVLGYALAGATFMALPRTSRLFTPDYRVLRKEAEPVGSRTLLKSAWFWTGTALIAVLIGATAFAPPP